jgi:hypothetical protein
MQNEVHLIVRKAGALVSGSLSEPAGGGGVNKVGSAFVDNPTGIIGQIVTITDASDNEYTATITAVEFDTVYPGIYTIFFEPVIFFLDTPIFYSAPTGVEVYLDLYPLESISQTFNFQDMGTFAALGDFTREFRIPASDRNTEVFGLLDSFTFSDTDNVYQTRIPAEIRVDTLPIARGHIRVLKTFKRNDQIADIQICFYGEAPDLFRSVGDKMLRDIGYLSTLNETITYVNATDVNSNRAWGIVDRGQRWSQAGEANTRPIQNSENPIYAGDLTPFVNAWTLFYHSIAEAGFTLAPTPLQTILSGYWCPWLSAQNVATVEQVGDIYFNAGFTSNTSVTDHNNLEFPALVNNGGAYGIYKFYAPFDGFFTFRVWLHVQPVGSFGANVGGVRLILNGVVVVNHEVAISGTDQNNGVVQNVLFTTVPIYMASGQSIVCYTEFNGTPIFRGSATNDPAAGSGWELVNFTRNYGATINYQTNAPNIKQVDFIRDVLAMHAAVLVPSRTIPSQLSIVPIRDYIASGNDYDWTSKLDIAKDITLSPTTEIQRRNFLFSYKPGGDYNSKLFTESGRTYGEYKIIDGYTVSANNTPNQFASGDLKTQLVAESTPASYINGTSIPIPKFINDKGEFLIPNLRFLFLADVATMSVYNDDTEAVVDTAVNVFNHYSSVNASVGDYDLNFNPETPLHTIITNPYKNLFNEYWRDYLNGLYNPEARILEAYFALDLTDILTFSYADRYFIKDSYWRILEISDYKVGNAESVKVKLIKITEPGPDCEGIPTTVVFTEAVAQVIEFADINGNPVPPTEICCERYGYTWSFGLNQCLSYGTPIILDPDGGGGSAAALMLNVGVNGSPSNVLARTANTNIDVGNTFSVFAGENITIDADNSNTLAVGNQLKLEGANRGSAILGKNAFTNIMGIHYGGGDRVSSNEGNQQSGVIILANTRNFTAAGQSIEIATGNDGTAITRISLPDGTSITALYVLQVSDVNGKAFYQTGSLYIEKIGGVAVASTPIPITSDASGTITFVLSIDTSTDTTQHRFKVTSAGIGFPMLGQAVLTLYYTQTR